MLSVLGRTTPTVTEMGVKTEFSQKPLFCGRGDWFKGQAHDERKPYGHHLKILLQVPERYFHLPAFPKPRVWESRAADGLLDCHGKRA